MCYKLATKDFCCSSAKEHTCEGGLASRVRLFWKLDAWVSCVACAPLSLALPISKMRKNNVNETRLE